MLENEAETYLFCETLGTSNTIMFGERAHGKLDNNDSNEAQNSNQYWQGGYYADSLCEGYYPPNHAFKLWPIGDPDYENNTDYLHDSCACSPSQA